MTQFINLTPHTINVEGLGALPSQGAARCATTRETLPSVAGVRLVRQAFGQVEGLPECLAPFTWCRRSPCPPWAGHALTSWRPTPARTLSGRTARSWPFVGSFADRTPNRA